MKKNTFYAQLYGHMAQANAQAFKDASEAFRWFFSEAARMVDDHNLTGEVYWLSPEGQRVQLAKINTGQWRLMTP